jgi:glutathione S-transferase
MDDAPPRLLTFAPMIDSELCRLLLARYGIAHRETPHVFGWASVLALWHGGTLVIPLLHGGGLRLAGPSALLAHGEAVAAPALRLRPEDPGVRAAAEADWEAFYGRLTTETAVYAYFHLLPARGLTEPVFATGVPRGEAMALRLLYPLLARLMSWRLGLSPARAATARQAIEAAVAAVEQRIADGRGHLHGGRLSLADLGLAVALAPLLQPPGYGAPIPPVAALPPPLRETVEALRARPVAGFVAGIYAELLGR